MSEGKEYHRTILDHYRRVAKNNGDRPTSTMGDQVIRGIETEFFVKAVRAHVKGKKKFKLLEVGHGNGHLLSVLSAEFPKASLYGMEFSPELFEISKARNLPGVELANGDACEGEHFPKAGNFDVVITERVVINVLERPDQYLMVQNIAHRLKKGGLYLMAESFREPLVALNLAREEVSLPPVPVPAHNLYLSEKFLAKCLDRYNLTEVPGPMASNHLSTYFYLTRVGTESLRKSSGGNPFNHLLGFMRQALPPAIGNYSPILLRSFVKK